ncbi:hypothetical protein BC835DRAFT_1295834, partial [Cytidiella melzeri]
LLHTLDKGSVPATAVQLHCSYCRTSYHYKYYVSNGRHVFYAGVPAILQVSAHRFVEVRLIDMWINSSLISGMAAGSSAKLYNMTLAEVSRRVAEFPAFSPFLHTNEISDSFVLLCLLQNSQKYSTVLDVPHHGLHEDRFKQAMEECNLHVSAVVIDGINIGHPCCSVHNCHIPLASQRHRFCPTHAAQNQICTITSCDSPVTPGSHVFQNPSHVNIQHHHVERGQARFQLQHCLQHTRATMPDSMPGDADASLDIGKEDFNLDGQGRVVPEEADPPVCPSKPSARNKRVRAQFGHKRTHNEQQIIVAPCGVIIARTTFYGANAVSSVAKLVKQVYRKAPRPEHIIFDNNCSLAKVVKGDPFFQDIGLSVDIFHFSCKHSITDTFCQEHCRLADQERGL